jgi:hypothetical protein
MSKAGTETAYVFMRLELQNFQKMADTKEGVASLARAFIFIRKRHLLNLSSVWVHTVNLDDRRGLGQVCRHNDLQKRRKSGFALK